MGNDGFRYKIEIKKEESFRRMFIDFMGDLGFSKDYASSGAAWEHLDNIFIGPVNSIRDFCVNFNNKDFDVDVFLGDKKVILSVRTKKRAKLIKILEKYSKWVKPKKFPKPKKVTKQKPNKLKK